MKSEWEEGDEEVKCEKREVLYEERIQKIRGEGSRYGEREREIFTTQGRGHKPMEEERGR